MTRQPTWALSGLICVALAARVLTASAAESPRVQLVAGAATAGTEPRAGELHEPFAIDADGAGNLYIAEMAGGRVLRLDSLGQLSVFAGLGEKGASGDGGPAAKAQFNGMHHLAVTSTGDVYVADTWNNRVRKIDHATGIIKTVVGTGAKGFAGDGGLAIEAQCGGIYCLALDSPRHRLVLADLDNRRVRIVNLEDGKIQTLAGNGERGVPVDGSLAVESPLVDPRTVACDSKGNTYILERGGHALHVVDTKGRIRTVAGTGKRGPAADDVAAAQATLFGPKHLCIDREDNVIVADSENHVIRKFLVRENRILRIVGTGTQGTAGIDGPPLNIQLNRPHGVFVDRNGALYVVDSENHRVLKVAS